MKRVLHKIPVVLKILLFIFAIIVLVFTLLSVFSFDRDNGIFGFRMYIVISDSMRGTFNAGDVIVVREVNDPSMLGEGDIITFKSIDPANYGETVTHKIRGRTEFEGRPAFITYGTATGSDDAVPALEERVLGKYMCAIPKVGYIFSTMKTPVGYLLIVLLPFLLLIGFEGANFIRLFKEYKSEAQQESDDRVKDLEKENERLREMMEKLEQQKDEIASETEKENENSNGDELKEDMKNENEEHVPENEPNITEE